MKINPGKLSYNNTTSKNHDIVLITYIVKYIMVLWPCIDDKSTHFEAIIQLPRIMKHKIMMIQTIMKYNYDNIDNRMKTNHCTNNINLFSSARRDYTNK